MQYSPLISKHNIFGSCNFLSWCNGQNSTPYKGKMISYVKQFLKDAKHLAFKEGLLVEQYVLHGNPSEEIMNLMKKEKFLL